MYASFTKVSAFANFRSTHFDKMVYNFKVFKKCAPNGKLTLYMGRRDFVDYISAVEPIGKIMKFQVENKLKRNIHGLSFSDGVILLDPEYTKGRKVYGQVICSFRYGREEDEVMGLNFHKELFLASEQLYPPPEKRTYNLTKLQVFAMKIISMNEKRACFDQFDSRCRKD